MQRIVVVVGRTSVCGSPMLSAGIVTATSADEACKDVDIAVMVRQKAQGRGWGWGLH